MADVQPLGNVAAAAARVEIKVNQLGVEGIAEAISYIKCAFTFPQILKVGQPTPYTYTY